MIDPETLINLTEPELRTKIYRIYKKEYLLRTLATGTDSLVNPSDWDDPFENMLLARTEVYDSATKSTSPLSNLASDWYGQCWSLLKDSDAMWRIYSPKGDGETIKVRTTVGKLLSNIGQQKTIDPSLQIFIGKVKYLKLRKIKKMMNSLSFSNVAIGASGKGFADLLAIKRKEFAHEAEVRLMLCAASGNPSNLFSYPLVASDVFEEFVLDPRLDDKTKLRIEGELRQAGWQGPCKKSQLYSIPKFVIPM